MRNRGAFFGILIVVGVWTLAVPGLAQRGGGGRPAPAAAKKEPAAPAPVKDISGWWLGGGPIPRKEPVPPMTAWGQAFFDATKPLSGPRAVPIVATTDPLVTCDPMGFPRSDLYETRGIGFVHVPKKTVQLLQYQKMFREIWTDGRPLPTDVGKAGSTNDPRYYGYSVGSWVDDYTFVVKTTGFDETAWLDEFGHPRSQNAMVEERYHRVDHDTLDLTVTIDDPKAYTKSFVAMNHTFAWSPKEEVEEQLCLPSESIDYRTTFSPPGLEKK